MDSPEEQALFFAAKVTTKVTTEPAKLVWQTPRIETLSVRDTKSGLINAGFETNFLFNQQCDFQFCQS